MNWRENEWSMTYMGIPRITVLASKRYKTSKSKTITHYVGAWRLKELKQLEK